MDRDTGSSDPVYTKLKTKDLYWWNEDIEGQLNVVPGTRHILESYSSLPPSSVLPHISQIRSTLWSIRAYPCVGLSIFLVPVLKYHSHYASTVLPFLLPKSYDPTHNKKFLDVGCYIGNDLRALHFDGIPQSSLYGLDILPFMEQGWELFRDKDVFKLGERYVLGDLMDDAVDSEASQLLDGKMDVVWCGAVVHQFDRRGQIKACKRLLRFTSGPGALVIGVLIGHAEAGEVHMPGGDGGVRPWRNNLESLKEIWEETGREAGVKIKVEVGWKEWEEIGCERKRCLVMGEGTGALEFTVFVL